MTGVNARCMLLAIGAALVSPAFATAQQTIELEGPIAKVEGTKIELYGGIVSFEAQGATIEADDESFRNIADFKPGTDIEVEAEVRTDGTIVAKRIEVSDEKNPDTEMVGVIGKVDEGAGVFTIGPITVGYDGATRLKGMRAIQAGLFVEVTLDVTGDRLRARVIEREDAKD